MLPKRSRVWSPARVPDVFISYARHAAPTARRVARLLQDRGYSVWFDAELAPNRSFADAITEQLEAARAVLALWSSEAAKSEWVRSEADFARKRGKLVQATLDGTSPPLPFDQIHCASLEGWRGDAGNPQWTKLLQAIGELAAADPPPHAPAGPAFPSRKSVVVAAVALVLLALGGLGWLLLGRSGGRSEAVFISQFASAGTDPSAQAVAAGVGQEVAGVLAQHDVRVVLDRQGPGRARLAVSGSVQSDGAVLRLSAQIKDTVSREVLWSDSLDRPAAQSLSLQHQAAIRIGSVLDCARESGDGRAAPLDRDSLRLFLQACDRMSDPSAADQVRDLMRRVQGKNPRFARGWAVLATAGAIASSSLPSGQVSAAREEARSAAGRALELDPKTSTAYLALYYLEPLEGRWLERGRLLDQGLALDPDEPSLLFHKARVLSQIGRTQEALTFARRARTLDPLSPVKAQGSAQLEAGTGHVAEALADLQKASRNWPDASELWLVRMGIEARQGDPEHALQMLDDAGSRPADLETSTVETWRRLAQARRAGGARAQAYAHDELERLHAGKTSATAVVLNLLTVGRVDEAFAALDTLAPSQPFGTEVLFRPQGEGLRRDRRFIALASRLGLAAVWRTTGVLPDFCSDRGLPYDCRSAMAR